MVSRSSPLDIEGRIDKSQWKLEHCVNCLFYECELVNEYLQYKKNYINDSKPVEVIKRPALPENQERREQWERLREEDAEPQPDTTPLSYNQSGCPIWHPICGIYCSARYVSDGIGEHFMVNTMPCYKLNNGYRIEKDGDYWTKGGTFDRWEPSQSVIISAQTGSGKNTFIEKSLLPYVRELNHRKGTNQKVLILSNRIALTAQVKNRLKQGLLYEDDNEEERMYSYSEHIKDILGGEYADVMSYQGFLNRAEHLKNLQGWRENKHGETKHKKEQKYIFVICDEAHFFTSDSMFNPYTGRILFHITKIFRNAIRVFMTATPYECYSDIHRHESLSIFYHFKRDYSYLDIKYYSKFEELHNIIEDSGNENWLIFIDNENEHQKQKAKLESIDSLNGKVYTVSAASKHDKKYQMMVRDERIDVSTKNDSDIKEIKTRVLIATSVIDNGVNFRNIKNVVISDISKVKCLQMVGRARKNYDEKITLYIKRFTIKEIFSRIRDLQKRQDAYHDFNRSKKGSEAWFAEKYLLGGQKDSLKPEHWIGANKYSSVGSFSGNYLINGIADSLTDSLLSTYEAILKEMHSEVFDKENENIQISNQMRILPGQKYLEYMLSWFGHTYDKENDISLIDKKETRNNLIDFLETYAVNETQILKDDKEKFSKKLTSLYDSVYPRRNKNKVIPYGAKVIKDILAELRTCAIIT